MLIVIKMKCRLRALLTFCLLAMLVYPQCDAKESVGTTFREGVLDYRIISENEVSVLSLVAETYEDAIQVDKIIIPDEVAYNGNTYLVTEVEGFADPDISSFNYRYNFTDSNGYIEIGENIRKFHPDFLRICGTGWGSYIISHREIPPFIESNSYISPYWVLLTEYPDAYKDAQGWSDMIIVEECHTGKLPDNVGYTIGANGWSVQIYSKMEGNTGNVVVPEIVEIGGKQYIVTSCSFSGDQLLTSIKLPATVTFIGKQSFYGCQNLQAVTGENVKTVDNQAFYDDKNLKSAKFSDKGCCFYPYAMYGCGNLTDISKITDAMDFAFTDTSIKLSEEDCLNLKTIWFGGLPADAYPPNLYLKDVQIYGEVSMNNIETIILDNVNISQAPDGNGGMTNGFIHISGPMPKWMYAVGSFDIFPFIVYDSGRWLLPYGEDDVKIGLSPYYVSDEDKSYKYSELLDRYGQELANAYLTFCNYISGSYDLNGPVEVSWGNKIEKYGKEILSYSALYEDELGLRLEFVSPGIDSVEIDPTTYEIGEKAFTLCKNIRSITLPNSLKSIKGDAFNGCTSLSTINFPDGPVDLHSDCFSGTMIESIMFPSDCKYVPNGAGDWRLNCPALKRVSNFRARGGYFTGDSLKSITRYGDLGIGADDPRVFKKIGSNRVSPQYLEERNCTDTYDPTGKYSLVVSYPDDCVIDRDYVYSSRCDTLYFAHCALDTMRIIPSVNVIHPTALQGCEHTGRLEITSGHKPLVFPANAFLGTAIDTLYVDRSFENGSDYCIFNDLKQLIIGENVESIGESAFSGSNKLSTIKLLASTAPILPYSAFSEAQYQTVEIEIDPANIDTYLSLDNNWRNFKSLQDKLKVAAPTHNVDGLRLRLLSDNEVEVVGHDNADELSQLTIPATVMLDGDSIPHSVTKISSKAFAGCETLMSLTIPSSIRHIGNFAFAGCGALIDIDGIGDVETIDGGAFQNCKSIKSADLSGLRQIAPLAFEGCSKLSAVVFADSLEVVGDRAFLGCSSFKTIELPKGCVEIGERAFYGCNATTVDLTESRNLKRIGNEAFYQHRAAAIVLPDSVEYIGKRAFAYARLITDLTLPDNDSLVIDDGAFTYCDRMNRITFPKKFKMLGESAFESTPVNGDLYLNAGYVGDYAFRNSMNIGSVKFGTELKTLRGGAFFDTAVTDVEFLSADGDGDAVVEVSTDCFNNSTNDRYLSHLVLGNRVKSLEKSSLRVNGSVDLGTTLQRIATGCDINGRHIVIPPSLDVVESRVYADSLIVPFSPEILRATDISGKYAFYDRNVRLTDKDPWFAGLGEKIAFGDTEAADIRLSSSRYSIPYSRVQLGKAVSQLSGVITKEMIIDESRERLEPGSFGTHQASLRIPSAMVYIAPGAIGADDNLSELIIDESSRRLELSKESIMGADNLRSVFIGRNFETPVGYAPFTLSNMQNLEKAAFGSLVTKVPENMFSGCSALTNVITPDNISEIGANAYKNCTSLRVLSISANITRIGNDAYSGCANMERIVARGLTPPNGNVGFGQAVEENVPLYVPDVAYDDYADSDLFFMFKNIYPHNENIVASVMTDANLREVEPGSTIDIVNTYGVTVNMIGNGASTRISPRVRSVRERENDSSVELFWFSTNPQSATVTQDGVVSIYDTEAAEIYAVALDGSDEFLKIGVNDILLGDSNDDGFITVTDAVNTANYAVDNEVLSFLFKAADVNKDDKITLSDASATIGILFGQSYANTADSPMRSASAQSHLAYGDYLEIGSCSVNDDGSASIGVKLDSKIDYVALQTDIHLPDGMRVVNVTGGPRIAEHMISFKEIGAGTVRLALFNPDNEKFIAGDGNLFNINVRFADNRISELMLSNIIASDCSANEYRLSFVNSNDSGSQTHITPDTLENEIDIYGVDKTIVVKNASGSTVCIYNLQGVMENKLIADTDVFTVHKSKGLYLVTVNGKTAKINID